MEIGKEQEAPIEVPMIEPIEIPEAVPDEGVPVEIPALVPDVVTG